MRNNVKGGHAKYLTAKEEAEKMYKQAKGLGPLSEHVLHEYLENKTEIERHITNVDNQLSKAEKDTAVMAETVRQEQEKTRLKAADREEMHQQMINQKKEFTKALEKLEKEYKEKFDQLMKEKAEAVAQKNESMKSLTEQGFEKQAKEYKDAIEEIKRDINEKEKRMLQDREFAEKLKSEKVMNARLIDKVKDMEANMAGDDTVTNAGCTVM